MMKNRSWTTALTLLVACSALASVLLCVRSVSYTREIRSLQSQTLAINNNRKLLNSLAADLVRYGQTNPDIFPLLESVGVRVTTNTTANTPVQ